MRAPEGDDWVGLSADPLPVGAVTDWVGRPDCGASRSSAATPATTPAIARASTSWSTRPTRSRPCRGCRPWWPRCGPAGPTVGRVAILHRTGALAVGDTAVVVAVSTPHRAEAFAAARFAIDAVKASVPIWKKERWDGGDDWGLEGNELLDPAEVRG